MKQMRIGQNRKDQAMSIISLGVQLRCKRRSRTFGFRAQIEALTMLPSSISGIIAEMEHP